MPSPALLRPVSLLEALGHDVWDRLEPMISGWRQSELADAGRSDLLADIEAGQHDDWWCSICKAPLSSDGSYGQPLCWCTPPGDAEVELGRPAPTLVGGSERSHVAARSVVSASKQRRDRLLTALGRHTGGYSVDEAAMLQGFPAGWPFQGSAQARYRQIANAAPPQLVQVVARAVREWAIEGGVDPWQ